MTYGYSQNTVAANKSANKRALGVSLGRACIAQGVSVYSVARKFKVSRQTVYNWFAGKHEPSPELIKAISTYVSQLKK